MCAGGSRGGFTISFDSIWTHLTVDPSKTDYNSFGAPTYSIGAHQSRSLSLEGRRAHFTSILQFASTIASPHPIFANRPQSLLSGAVR
ncbi:hypothetical protein Sjap_005443 [Stephania japonica]|uniref:Uncharacterized protein n=1 Tax=Stephania japonica TaxID=461633 RepID=A0AAP0PL53_9MAGN